MKTNTTAKASAKANTTNTTTATATANKAATPAPAKTEPAALDVVESYKIAAALLSEHKTTSAIKAISASLREKYGAKNWATIWATVKELRTKDITAAAADVRAVVLDYAAALETEYKRAAGAGKWADLMKYARGQWSTGAEFIAANYPNTIDGQPAARVDYVGNQGATIVTAYQPAPRDARRAVSDIYAALGALERATRKASNGGKDGATITGTTARKAGAIVAAFNMEFKTAEDGRQVATKGAPVDAATLAKLTKYTTAGLVTLKDYNAKED
ncbi:MAG: hypothetical protein PUK22_04580 [Bacteroides sp.]|nr:hypothetical protein [Bacteroides sp.]